jgi:recombination protein RecR
MGIIPKSLKALTLDLQRLPGIGPKSARRMAYFLFNLPQARLDFLAETIKELKNSVSVCQFCHILSDTNPCEICGDSTRDNFQVCVVEDHMDVYSIEKSGGFRGVYYVLGGLLSPAKGTGPEDLDLDGLKKRIEYIRRNSKEQKRVEVILALSPTTEGQTTALYIKELIAKDPSFEDVDVTRVAIGISVGSDIDYVDSFTLQEALRGRSKL